MANQTITLAAARRDPAAKPRAIRAEKKIPAIYYGAGVENLTLTLGYQEFRKAYKAAGESTIIDLTVDADAPRKVLVHAVDYDPVTDAFSHVDFINVDMKKPITAHIPVKFVGVAPAIKSHGGIFVHNKTEVAVKCLPADLPHALEANVEKLTDIHSALHISDIVAPSGVTILDAADLVIATIAAPKTEAELEAELATPIGDTVSEDARKEAEAAKAAAQASKESDTEKKMGKEK